MHVSPPPRKSSVEICQPVPSSRHSSEMEGSEQHEGETPPTAGNNTQNADNQLLAYGLVFASTTCFCVSGCAVKSSTVPAVLLLWLRSAFQIVLAAIMWFILKPPNAPKTWRVIGLLFLRALCYLAFIVAWWITLRLLPLGDATTLVYISPVFSGFIAYAVLRESLNLKWFVSVVINLGGVVLVSQPSWVFSRGTPLPTSGVVVALLAAFLVGVLPVLTRHEESRKIHWVYVEGVTHVTASILVVPLVYAGFSQGWLPSPGGAKLVPDRPGDLHLDAKDWGFVVMVTATGFLGLCLNTKGYQIGEATKTSLVGYLEIPLSYVLQIWLYGEHLTTLAGVGAGLILGSSLFTVLQKLFSKDDTEGYEPIPTTAGGKGGEEEESLLAYPAAKEEPAPSGYGATDTQAKGQELP